MKPFNLAILIALFASALGCSTEPPTDASIRTTFLANRDAFDQLHQMIQSEQSVRCIDDDMVGNVYYITTDSMLDDALSVAGLNRRRYDKYMKLLRQVGAYKVSIGSYNSKSIIGMYSEGNVAESLRVDVVFLAKQPDKLVDDTVAATIADNSSAYLELDDSWYIFREHD